jgi:glucokinase
MTKMAKSSLFTKLGGLVVDERVMRYDGNMADSYLGIDIGGTALKRVIIRGIHPHEPVIKERIDTPRTPDEFFSVLEGLIREFISKEQGNIAGIGGGIPGVFGKDREAVLSAPNLPFLNGWEAKKFFGKFGVPIKLDNDSRCLLRAEMAWGAGRGYRDVIALSIGTGIGGGIAIAGKIYCGASDSAGEVGHMIIDGENGRSLEGLGARSGAEKWGDRSGVIGIGIANIINVVNPEIVVLGGGGAAEGKINLKIVREAVRKFVLSPIARKTPIVAAQLGDFSQAIGAALFCAKLPLDN